MSLAATAQADVSQETIDALGAPDSVETSIGTLDFKDGAPTAETAQKVFDALYFTNALNVYNNSFRGASALGIAKGFQEHGRRQRRHRHLRGTDGLRLAVSDRQRRHRLLPRLRGSFRWTGGDRAADRRARHDQRHVVFLGHRRRQAGTRPRGGKYLIVGPGYDGPLPEGGYFVAHSSTNTVLYATRAFIKDGDDPKPAVENIKENLKIYPYVPGSFGTPIAEALKGTVKLAGEPEIPEMKFINGSGKSFNTIPPSDYGFFEWVNENVQTEPATSYDIELAGQLAAIGIVKGKDFAPDDRMKKILTDAAAVGQGVGRALQWNFADKHPGWAITMTRNGA